MSPLGDDDVNMALVSDLEFARDKIRWLQDELAAAIKERAKMKAQLGLITIIMNKWDTNPAEACITIKAILEQPAAAPRPDPFTIPVITPPGGKTPGEIQRHQTYRLAKQGEQPGPGEVLARYNEDGTVLEVESYDLCECGHDKPSHDHGSGYCVMCDYDGESCGAFKAKGGDD